MNKRPQVLMPEGANIPNEWIKYESDKVLTVVMPSRTLDGGTWTVVMDKETRKLSCQCPAFSFNSHCHHTAGLVYLCHRVGTKGIQGTSLAAYNSFTPDELSERQAKVYDELLKNGPGSNNEIAARLLWPINTITPRVLELRDMGTVIEFGEQMSACNKPEKIWMAVRWAK